MQLQHWGRLSVSEADAVQFLALLKKCLTSEDLLHSLILPQDSHLLSQAIGLTTM